MNLELLQSDEYELQYYQFSSTDFINDLKDLILSTIKEACDNVLESAVKNLPQDKILNCQKQISNIYDAYNTVTLKTIQCIEGNIRECFAIPKHVLLPSDEHNVSPCSQSDVDHLKNEVKKLEEQYVKKRLFKYLCEKELEILESLEGIRLKISNIMIKMTGQTVDEDKSILALVKMHNELTSKLFLFESEIKFNRKIET